METPLPHMVHWSFCCCCASVDNAGRISRRLSRTRRNMACSLAEMFPSTRERGYFRFVVFYGMTNTFFVLRFGDTRWPYHLRLKSEKFTSGTNRVFVVHLTMHPDGSLQHIGCANPKCQHNRYNTFLESAIVTGTCTFDSFQTVWHDC
jgi:hypothetical protein